MSLLTEFVGTKAVSHNDIFSIEAFVECLNRLELARGSIREEFLFMKHDIKIYFIAHDDCYYATYCGIKVAKKEYGTNKWERIL